MTLTADTRRASPIEAAITDIDHVLDYAYYQRTGTHRLILLLHGYEYAIVGGIAAWLTGSVVIWALVISYLIHLLADQVENRTHWLGYSLVFRAWHRFRIERISISPQEAVQGRMDDLRLLKRLFRR